MHPTGVQLGHNPRRPNLLTSIPQPEQFKTCFWGGTYILKLLTRGLAMSTRHCSKSSSFTAPQLAPFSRNTDPISRAKEDDLDLGLGSQDGEIGVGFQILDMLLSLLALWVFLIDYVRFDSIFYNKSLKMSKFLNKKWVSPFFYFFFIKCMRSDPCENTAYKYNAFGVFYVFITYVHSTECTCTRFFFDVEA